MENYNETIKKLELIIEQSNTDAPACKNCCSYKNGGCSFGCMNERLKLIFYSKSKIIPKNGKIKKQQDKHVI